MLPYCKPTQSGWSVFTAFCKLPGTVALKGAKMAGLSGSGTATVHAWEHSPRPRSLCGLLPAVRPSNCFLSQRVARDTRRLAALQGEEGQGPSSGAEGDRRVEPRAEHLRGSGPDACCGARCRASTSVKAAAAPPDKTNTPNFCRWGHRPASSVLAWSVLRGPSQEAPDC
jgi:hypothetical protein